MRVSGQGAKEIAKKLTKREDFTPRYSYLTSVYDKKDDLIDESIVVYFQAPHSFTAEDIVEFQCHGGIVVASIILEEVIHCGARLANPGEFSKRAFLNGRIDLCEAEAIAKLIETKSIDSAKILARQMKGELKDFVYKIREDLIEILAFVEVNIDYAEEDLPPDLVHQISDKLSNLSLLLKTTYDSSKKREGLIEGFRVAIVGKPNVGKSSLLNSLLNYDRAIISEIAGTTRDTIEEEIRIGTHLIKIVDTAGIREANDDIEKIGVQRSKIAIESADIVIALFDNSRVMDGEDELILDIIKNHSKDRHVIKVLNKIDLPKRFNSKNLDDFIQITCKKNSDLVVEKLKKILDFIGQDDSLILTSKRQMLAVKSTYEEIILSKNVLNEGELELFAFHINEAISSITKITKNFERDEILDKMFGSFCLGK